MEWGIRSRVRETRKKKVEKKRVRNLRGVWQEGLYASEII